MQHLYRYVYDVRLPRTSVEMVNDKRFRVLKLNEPIKEGDLVFFRIDDEKLVSHVGIYLKNDRFFAAGSRDGCNIASLKKEYWKNSFVAASRLRR